jgi:hypothetical protein
VNLVHANRPVMAARANWGRWICDCPACPAALTLQPGTPEFVCWECGSRAEILWPSEDMARGVERLLMMRPLEQHRNWEPGETLHDLLAENVTHGIGPTEEGQQLMIVGDRIERDTLPTRRKVKAIA